MSVFLMDISTLVSGSRHLLRCGTFLQRQAVIGQFNRIDSTEAAPEKIFLSSLLYVERVDGILHIDFIAAEHLPVVLERSLRFIGSGTTDAAIPLASPNGHGIVEYVFITYLVDVRCPQTAVRLKIRSGTVGKGSTYICLLYTSPSPRD